MWETLQGGAHSNVPSLTRSWQLPWRLLSTLLIAGTGALFVRALPPSAAVTKRTDEAFAASPEQQSMLDDHALIGGSDPKFVSDSAASEPALPQPVAPKRPPAAVPSRKATPPPLAARTPTSSDEVGLLVRARRLLRSQPTRALELTQAHSAQYPHGMFSEERELLAIEALYQLGQSKLADQRSARFLATFRSSAHSSRIEALRSAK
jgi:hypothetical protein